MTGQVAAVHRGDVPRLERRERPGVVPVVEVAAVPLHRRHRLERARGAVDEPARRDVAEVVGRRDWRAAPAPCWSATCDAPRPERATPGSCPAAASDRRARRRCRRSPRSCARRRGGSGSWSAVSRASRRVSGRLICQVMTGAANQRSRMGAAAARPAGRPSDRYDGRDDGERGRDPHPRPRAGEPLAHGASLIADGVHSRRRLRVMSVRAMVRRAASRLKNASYGRQASVSSACAI